jgi:hypothetical protein
MRTAFSSNDAKSTPEKVEKDSYSEQILKFIPAEVVAFYLPALATAATLPGGETTSGELVKWGEPYGWAILIIFLAGLGATFVYMYKSAKKDLEEKKVVDPTLRAIIKAGISTIAFIIWAIYIGGVFQVKTIHNQIFGTLGILFFTLISPPLYDVLVGKLTLPSGIKMNYSHKPSANPPARISPVEVTNLYPTKITITAIEIYWKNWWRFAPETSLTGINEEFDPGEIRKIDKLVPFRKKSVTHIIKIRTENGDFATSEPFQD